MAGRREAGERGALWFVSATPLSRAPAQSYKAQPMGPVADQPRPTAATDRRGGSPQQSCWPAPGRRASRR
eukprot:1809986-Pyramimonas_sp.AAC.1